MIDCNATQAAIRAGYNTHSAYSQGQRLLKNVEVKNYIAEQLEQVKSERIADLTEILEYLTNVIRGGSESEIVVVEGKGDGVSQSVKVRKAPDEKERLKAAELLGKRYGAFTDSTNSVNVVSPVVFITGENDLI